MSRSLPQFEKLLSSKYTAIAIILIASAGVYLNTLSNEFVSDDEFQILKNPWIKNVKYIPNIFLSDMWAFEGEGTTSNYYRPILHIVYMIDYYVFGLRPWGFHLTYIIFHAGVAILVFLIASMLTNQASLTPARSQRERDNWIALMASLLFATHPIHTEAVNLGGLDPIFTFFYLLSFYLYINAERIWSKRFIPSLVFFFLATLCKETALTLPLLLFAYDYSFKKEPLLYLSPKTFYLLVKKYIPYLIAAVIYFIMRTYAIGGLAPVKSHPELSNWQHFINIFPLFAQYLEKLIFPINLNYFYVLHPISSILELRGVIAFIITSAFIFFTYIFRRNKIALLSFFWIVIPILPVLYISGVAGENTFAERYLYLPSVGFAILVSIAIERIPKLMVLGKDALPVIIILLVVATGFYSIGTIKRNYIWKDNYTLWMDTVEKSPDGDGPHNDLGVAYYRKGLLDKAIEHFQIAISLKPYYYPNAYYNLGAAYYRKGLTDEAIKYYQIALMLGPDHSDTYYNLGVAYYRKGLVDKAIEYYKIALRLKPDFPEASGKLREILINRKVEEQGQR